MCVLGVCMWVCIHSLSGAASSGLLCPCANSWDAGKSYWPDWVSDPDAQWGEPYCVHVYIHTPTSRFSPWTARVEQGEAVGAVCASASAEFMSVLVSGAKCVYMLMCGFCKGACRLTIGYTRSVWLLVGPEGTELQQPSLCWATGFEKPNQWPRIEFAQSKYVRVIKCKIVWTELFPLLYI